MGVDVILLNGGSSAGKTTLAGHIQRLLPGPWLAVGIDDLLAALPGGRDPSTRVGAQPPLLAIDPSGRVGVGPDFRRYEAAWYAGIAAAARRSVGVVVDDVFLDGGTSQARVAAALVGLDVLWVGVRCAPEMAARREATRPDRVAGMAESQALAVHRGVRYDLEVDTTTTAAADCAEIVGRRVLAEAGDEAAAAPGPRSGRVVVVEYDPAWPARAATLQRELHDVLPPGAHRLAHVGSTAVPGMAAKDVVDLQLAVEDLATAAGALDGPLRAVGYRRAAPVRDHVPAGRPADEPGWEKLLWIRRRDPRGDVNLHVRQRGAPNERLALLFRDWLRAHPAAVAAYSAWKRALSVVVDDLATYADVKDPVVDLVVASAEPWAAATGWQA